MSEATIGDAAKLVYLVDRLEDVSPQAGKTVVQKMMFLLDKKGVVNYDYSLYHYGPYSPAVESDLNYVEFLDGVEIHWIKNEGYFITPGSSAASLEESLSDEEKGAIDGVVKNFGKMMAKDLSLLATVLYFWDRFEGDSDRLTTAVKSVKPQYSERDIGKKIKLLEGRFFGKSG
jgi:uncharacterized protein YwgA